MLTLERFKDIPELKREIIRKLHAYVAGKAYGEWYKYDGEFQYEGNEYELSCECKTDNQIFTYRNLHISHKQKVIDIESMPELYQ